MKIAPNKALFLPPKADTLDLLWQQLYEDTNKKWVRT